MDLFKDRRVVAIGGAALALAAGLAIAIAVAVHQGSQPDEAAPASQGGLMVQTGRDDDLKLTPGRALRCFVGGHLVGEMTVSDCAKKNGVATGALDVGIDSSGALSAGAGPSNVVTPLPPEAPASEDSLTAPPQADSEPTVAPVGGAAMACWRYGGGTWRREPVDMTLNACVQNLFAGVCVAPGSADYGRWGQHTLRLVLGRVETSVDNRSFRPLVEQRSGCAIPALG
jgi:hypothetical protein